MVQAGVIDSGYTGEWFVALYNGNDIPVIIEKKQLISDLEKMKLYSHITKLLLRHP